MYNRYTRRCTFNPKNKHHVRHADIPARLTATLASGTLNAWETKTATSLTAFFKTHGCLTRKQYSQLRKFEQVVIDAPVRAAMLKKQEAAATVDPLFTQIKSLLSETELSAFEKTFLTSVSEQFVRKGSLSPKQIDFVKKIAGNFTTEAAAARGAWSTSFDAEKTKVWETCVKFYRDLNVRTHAGYYSNLLVKACDGYIPTEQEYKKLCENKYSLNIVDAITGTPQFAVGDTVMLRSNFGKTPVTSMHRKIANPGDTVIIISNAADLVSSAKGCRAYEVLPFGFAKTFIIEERNIKKCRAK